jgi:hypothetical protein
MPLVTQSKCFFSFLSHLPHEVDKKTRGAARVPGGVGGPKSSSGRPCASKSLSARPPVRLLRPPGTRDAQLIRPPGRAAGTTPLTARRPRSSCASKLSSGCASPPPLRYTRDPRLLRQRAADRAPRTRRSSERRRPVQIQAVTPISSPRGELSHHTPKTARPVC